MLQITQEMFTNNDNKSSYGELLERDTTVLMHIQNLHALAVEFYKVLNGFSTEKIKDSFHLVQVLLATQEIEEYPSAVLFKLFVFSNLKHSHILDLKIGSLFQIN